MQLFLKFHHEQLLSAIERYVNEVNRVVGVLEGWLAKQKQEYGDSTSSDGPWLVGNKYSYADIAFIQWQRVIGMVTTKDQYDLDKFPHVKEWLGKMTSREAIKTALGKSDGKPPF
jgi:glutathione S-transferase